MKHFLLLSMLLGSFFGWSQVVMSGSGSYSQNFNTLLTTGSGTWADNSTIPSWYGQRSGTGNNIIAGDGSSNTGALYSFGTGTDVDRAFSGLGSGTPGHFALGAQFHNTSGGNLSDFTVSYTMEQWRNGGNATAQTLTFWYQVSSSPITALTPNNSTGWTAFTTLDATSPIATATPAALDGNQTANKVIHTNVVIPGLILANGEYLMIKWDDPNNTGNDHGLAIDDFSMSWSGSCNTVSSINVSECSSYTVPSGDEEYFASGIYHDTIPNAAMCDSVITINLTITGETTSSFSVTECTSYTVPSGDEEYFISGIYNDTIPNHLGCDSVMTINLTIATGITYYADLDTDGLGDLTNTVEDCSLPPGYVTNSNDCNDNDPAIGAATTWYLDADGDGYGSNTSTVNCIAPTNYVANNLDCNDANPNVHPGGTEIPENGIDEDCNGSDLTIPALGQYQFADHVCAIPILGVNAQPANATFSDYAGNGSITCTNGTGYINYIGWNETANIDLTEYYSFYVTPATCYGMNLTKLTFLHRFSGSAGTPTVHVRSSIDNYGADIATIPVTNLGTDLNETILLPSGQFGALNTAIEFRFYVTGIASATATYRHDNVSLFGTLNALTPQTYFVDNDGDTYGDPATPTSLCVQLAGYVLDNTDCNDNNINEHPGAVWAIDADGDGYKGGTTTVSCTQPINHIPVSSPVDCNDNDNQVTGQTTYYADADGDGFGDNGVSQMACSAPMNYVTDNTDCDDSDDQIGANAYTFYADTDNDGLGNPAVSVQGCTAPNGYVSNDDDCDDTNNNPTAGVNTYYLDSDEDGFGDPDATVAACAQPVGYVVDNTDCNDADEDINPDATDDEGDGIDQNCDGVDGNLSVGESELFVITASPNPGTNTVLVSISENFGLVNAEMISADGRLVEMAFTQLNNGVEIDTKTLVPGMYIIRLTNGNVSRTVRWIKQ